MLFITIEDETSPTKVIVWPKLVEQQRREILNAKLLGVYGIWQTDGKVQHLIAKCVLDLTHLLGELNSASRNFC